MKMNEQLQTELRKKYAPSAKIMMKYKGNDLSFITDEEGNAVLLFIGTASHDGKIEGEQYSRTLKCDAEGVIIKDHWDLKGKAT